MISGMGFFEPEQRQKSRLMLSVGNKVISSLRIFIRDLPLTNITSRAVTLKKDKSVDVTPSKRSHMC